MGTRTNLENNDISAVKLREYEQLFFGTNQEGGYYKPFLAFTSDTTQQVLRADYTTYLHYPNSASSLPLSASRLVQNGACAGPIPYKADKIFQKNANYKKYIHWGNSTTPQQGRWLCAWLSAGSPGSDPTWIDRWYKPDETFSSTYLYSTSAVYDTPSEMYLEPGVWYKYFHIGDSFNTHIVDSLTGVASALKVYIDDWTLPIALDSTPYKNNCIITQTKGTQIVVEYVHEDPDTALFLTNNSFAEVVFDSSFNLNDNFTALFWVKSTNWAQAKGHHILSKAFRGGWSISYNNGFYNPIFTVFSNGGKGLIINENGNIQSLKTLPTPSTPFAVYTDPDLFTWIIDSNQTNRRLYKMDFDGTILFEKVFSDNVTLNGLTASARDTVFVYESAGGGISGFDLNGEVVFTSAGAIGLTNITNDLTGNFVGTTENDICIDNNGSIWEALTYGGIRKTGIDLVTKTNLTNLTAQNITCDSNNTIWITYDITSFATVNASTAAVILSGTVGSATTEGVRGISLTKEYDIVDNIYKDYVWFSFASNETIYKTTNTGILVKKIPLTLYGIAPSQTRFTSYDWNRKFNYIANSSTPQIQLDIYLGTTTSPVCGVQTLSFPVTSLADNDWHLLSFTKSSSGDIKFYADSTEKASVNIPEAVVYYDYETSLYIGTDTGKIQSLANEIGGGNLYYEGYIDGVRIYDYVLSDWDLWFIHNTKHEYSDVIWNMETGSQSYLEEIERFFKFKLPGQKSQFYNIRLAGLQIIDPIVRQTIEGIIKQTVVKIAPAHVALYKIIWE